MPSLLPFGMGAFGITDASTEMHKVVCEKQCLFWNYNFSLDIYLYRCYELQIRYTILDLLKLNYTIKTAT